MLEYPQRCVISGQRNFTIYSAINRCKCRASMVALTINGKITIPSYKQLNWLHIMQEKSCSEQRQ